MILWLAMFGQVAIPQDDQPWQVRTGIDKSRGDVARNDLAFERAVEETAMAAEPTTAIPVPYRGLVERLGSSCWSCREGASRRLLVALKANPGDARWLYWGGRHRDLEVRLRCATLIRRLHPCPTCAGTTLLHDKWDGSPIGCWDCSGSGSAIAWSMWD